MYKKQRARNVPSKRTLSRTEIITLPLCHNLPWVETSVNSLISNAFDSFVALLMRHIKVVLRRSIFLLIHVRALLWADDAGGSLCVMSSYFTRRSTADGRPSIDLLMRTTWTLDLADVSPFLVFWLTIYHDGSLGHQVKQLIEAAKEDEIGTYALGAMERVMAASEETIKTMEASCAM